MAKNGNETWREGWGCFESTAAAFDGVISAAVLEAYPRPSIRRLSGHDLLSRAVSAFRKLDRDEDECHADVDLWYAPSECHGDVARGFESDRQQLAEDFGFENGEAIWDAFAARTSQKCAYNLLGLH